MRTVKQEPDLFKRPFDPSLPRFMQRRSHKKSRRGCIECKTGHKKCDETRPFCVNCTIAKKGCSFSPSDRSQSVDHWKFILSTGPETIFGSNGSLTPENSNAASHTSSSSPQPLTPAPASTEPYVNILHLELFSNVINNRLSLFNDESSKDEWVTTVLRYTFSYPFLMYELLALSAFHLSIQHPTKSDIYLAESTNLQAQALSLFNSALPNVEKENVIPTFLFSGILGLHFICETLSTCSTDLNTFLDRLVQSIQLLRGVDTIVGTSWEYIRNSDIRCLLVWDDEVVDRDDEFTHAAGDLSARLSQSHTLSAFESKICCEAIESLLQVYNQRITDSTFGGRPDPRLITQWPITLSEDYTQLLIERKPEALIIMAYFAILLHSRRAFWAVGDAGRLLLAGIEEYLGVEWAVFLNVPRNMVLSL